jgi:glycosyltransferase involved in cell wall biosynthesis
VAPKAVLIGIVTAWLTAIPVRLHTFQGEVWTTRKGLWRRILKFADSLVATLATHILVVSKSEKQFLVNENVIDDKKSEVLGNGSICGVDLQRFKQNEIFRKEIRTKFSIADTDRVLLYIGRLNIDKGVLDLIKAFNVLNADGKGPLHLIIVGPDEERIYDRSQKLISGNGFKIHFENYTDYPEKYMSAADLLVLPSYREGFGLVIVEAAAAKIPSVGSNVYGISDAITDGETGLIFKVRDIADLAQKISTIIFNENLRKEMGEAAYRRCSLEFSQDKVVDRTLEYYRKILA